ncbi:MAG: hypothetical protein ACR2O4_01740 [Hyphomicrobiaceae bacterium]
MLLGSLIKQLDDDARAEETLIALGDVMLIAKVRHAAADQGLPLGAFMVNQIGAFNSSASPDAWMDLTMRAGRTTNPGAAVLKTILASSLDGAPPPA